MYSLIVLGQIPGTNISLSFEAWIILMALMAVVGFRLRPKIKQIFEEFKGATTPKHGIHASQLHQRAQ